MNNLSYEVFFELRDKYPQHKELIGELMRFAFTNNDSFKVDKYIELNDVFFEEDIKLICSELGLPDIAYILCAPSRARPYVMLRMSNTN